MATVILVGHGSSCDSGAGAPVRAHAARLRAEGAFRRVQPAFWKEAPHVGDVLAATTDEDVAIVPMFMSDGYFASQVLPRALGLHGPVTRRGAQRIHYTAPVGTHPRVPRLVERRALGAGAGPTSAVVIVGHGTERHALSDDSTWAAVRVLRNSGRFGVVAGAFLEEEPRIARTLEQLEAQDIVVVPFFLAEGDHTLTDIPAAALPAGWGLVKPGAALASTGGVVAGRRWAMVVDLRKECPDGCRDCIGACNTTHNVPAFKDEAEPKRHEIKWIWTEPYERTFPGAENQYMSEHMKDMPFLVLCNHCENPPCVRVCPTKATFKLTNGITMQDMHRCIGCRFCMAACPYGSRSFNWVDPRAAKAIKPELENKEYPTRTKGVVEKCTFCSERLQAGKIPACVEAAPKGAMFFGDIEDPNSEVRKIVTSQLTVRRKPELGTGPAVYYLIGGSEHA